MQLKEFSLLVFGLSMNVCITVHYEYDQNIRLEKVFIRSIHIYPIDDGRSLVRAASHKP